jgi:FAD/FMN-containing dehydrogenase
MQKNFVQLENYGRSLRTPSYLIKVNIAEEIYEAFHLAKKMGLSITARGAGRSYNDASLNGGGIILDMQGMNAITRWNKSTGQVTAQPGVTLEQLWQKVEPDGWWPPVVTGTMKTTLGGCLSTNVHGKNNFKMGPIGEHVVEFTAVLPTGAEITCSPKKNADLFYAMISGLGMLGIFTSITLQMKRIHSGLMSIHAKPVHNLHEQLTTLLEDAPHYDYIVGWMDAIARGRSLGRGQIHAARYLHEGEDQNAQETMKLERQIVPSHWFGIFPKSMARYFMTPFVNNLGMWGVNTGKYISSLRRHSFRQSHGSFHFLLDYVPLFSYAGLIQYQSFVPKETAETAWTEMLRLSHKNHVPSFLGVTKRHRPDEFLLSHAVDGFSLALDFKVTERNRRRLSKMLQDFDEIILKAGGRFYFAKNSETSAATTRAFLGDEAVTKFRKLKKRCDPHGLLESDLYRRIFGE